MKLAASKAWVQGQIAGLLNALAVHNNSPDAHGLAPLRLDVNTVRDTTTALAAMLRNSLTVAASDDFARADAPSLGNGWTDYFAGSAAIRSGAAAAPAGDTRIFGNRRPVGQTDVILSAHLNVPANGESSLIGRLNTSNSNHILVQGSGNALNIYFVIADDYRHQYSVSGVPTGALVELETMGSTATVRVDGVVKWTAPLPLELLTGTNIALRVSHDGRVEDIKALTLSPADGGAAGGGVPTYMHLLATRNKTVRLRDTFERADAETLGSPEVGPAWAEAVNTMPKIRSGAAVVAAGTDGAYIGASDPYLYMAAQVNVTASAWAGLSLGTQIPAFQAIHIRRFEGMVQIAAYDGSEFKAVKEYSSSPVAGVETLEALSGGGKLWVILNGVYLGELSLGESESRHTYAGIISENGGRIESVAFYALESL